jgi:alginate O-acetyltransferase complex protein AlgI
LLFIDVGGKMQFNSYVFILLFLPICISGYFSIAYFSKRWGDIFLLCSSIVFGAFLNIEGFLTLLACTIINWGEIRVLHCIKCAKIKKWILSIGIIFNIMILFWFKYFNFFVKILNDFFNQDFLLRDILLPIGISFIVFQQIAYLVDTYKRKTEDYTFIEYLLYIFYFPKLLSGPIVFSGSFMEQLKNQNRNRLNFSNISNGLNLFIIGLAKKILVADVLAKVTTWGMINSDKATSADWIIIVLAYTFQIYFDFSGYTDMAIGVSSMLNIKIPDNFNAPYRALSIPDFWKRWHITLTDFLREYVYFPLGGSKKGYWRTYINIMIIFLISGIWHGANFTFIIWGALHGCGSVIHRLIKKGYERLPILVKWGITFLSINILWALFWAKDVRQWIHILLSIVYFDKAGFSTGLIRAFEIPEYTFLLKCFRIPYGNIMIRECWMIVFLSLICCICLYFEKGLRREYKNTIMHGIGMALLFGWTVISLNAESTFVYFGF